MKIIEVKRIGAWSAGKLFGGIFFVLGLVTGFVYGLTGTLDMFPLTSKLPVSVEFSGSINLGLLGGLLFAVIYGLIGGLLYIIFSLVYNFFALILGGIKIKIQER